MQRDQQIDIEAWKELLLRRELEAIGQMSTIRALMARIQELEQPAADIDAIREQIVGDLESVHQ